MNARTWDRLAALLSIVLLAGLAAGAYYLAQMAERDSGPAGDRAARYEPDAFIDGFGLTRIDAHGRPVYRVTARRSVHYPDDDSTELFEATAVTLDPDTPRVTVRADRGRANAQAERTELFGNVVLTRAPQGKYQELRIETDYALVLPDPQIARTDRPVRITSGPSFLTGVGMEYDNIARTLRVDSRARGSWYDPDRLPSEASR